MVPSTAMPSLILNVSLSLLMLRRHRLIHGLSRDNHLIIVVILPPTILILGAVLSLLAASFLPIPSCRHVPAKIVSCFPSLTPPFWS